MKKIPIQPDLSGIPRCFHSLFAPGHVYDSSCSRDAQVYYLDQDGGLYLKEAPGGALETEAALNAFFHKKGLGPEVLVYLPGERDWMLTRKIPGQDCTGEAYLSCPQQLCDTTAQLLRRLHEEEVSVCPVTDRTRRYRSAAAAGYAAGAFDPHLFSGVWDFSSPEEAQAMIRANGEALTSQVLLHGDYCLPNIILDRWQFSGFIDLGNGGVGDRHFDVLWGLWTLRFNLKTNAYFDRFLDAYGRDAVHPELLRTAAAMEVFL